MYTLENETNHIVLDNRPKFLKDAIYQGELSSAPYALSVSSPKIEPLDKRLMKATAHESMQHQAEKQIQMLKKQAELLMKQAREIEHRLEVSHAIYKADINFEPVVNGVYHLYSRDDDSQQLSMVAPYEWGNKMPFKEFLHTVRLMGDKTWEVLS